LASEPERKSKGERQKEKVKKEGESKASSHHPSPRTARPSSIINESRASSYRLTFAFSLSPFDFKKRGIAFAEQTGGAGRLRRKNRAKLSRLNKFGSEEIEG
jgi:hypothetical protein